MADDRQQLQGGLVDGSGNGVVDDNPLTVVGNGEYLSLQLELARYTYAAGQRTSSKRDNDVNGQFVVPAGGQQESPLLVGVFSLS